MKVLIVSQAFYPEVSPRSFRATELAKEFSRQGHQVKVLSYYREGQEDLLKDYKIAFKSLGVHKLKPIKLKGGKIEFLWRRFWNRILGLFLEFPLIELVWMVKRSLKEERDYDMLISVAVPYPIHWGVATVRKHKGDIARVWLADCGDPYMGQENDSFKPPFYFGYVEKWFSRRADFITVPTNGAIKAYYPEFHNKIKVIPQGFRFEDIKVLPHHGDVKKIVFGYGGMFIPGRRDPSEFLYFLLQRAELNYEFHIYTATPQFVQDFANKSNGKIKVFEPVKRDRLLAEMSKMDFVVNFENVGSKQTPSKLIDYAIIDKPILSLKTGQLDPKLVEKFLIKNYDGSIRVESPERYRIENVVNLFIELIPEKSN
jgi:hypothetical protein